MNNNNNTYNSEQIANIINYPVNIIHYIVLSRWPNMVNRMLSIIEMAIDSESRQYSRVKKSLNKSIYFSRDNILLHFDNNNIGDIYNKKYILNFFYGEFSKMQDGIEAILNITFNNEKQRNSISQAIGDIEREVLNEVIESIDKEYND